VYAGTRGALEIVDERVIPLALDVTNTSQIQHASDRLGELDLLINNAGIAMQHQKKRIKGDRKRRKCGFHFGLGSSQLGSQAIQLGLTHLDPTP
jgi:NAD(P)-dependent dehydrogenase (short-subunit alcohol dehydrogenase family)